MKFKPAYITHPCIEKDFIVAVAALAGQEALDLSSETPLNKKGAIVTVYDKFQVL